MSLDSLHRRIDRALAAIEQRQHQVDTCGRVVLYDAATGYLLPGHEPAPHGITVYIPDNGRDNYAGRLSA